MSADNRLTEPGRRRLASKGDSLVQKAQPLYRRRPPPMLMAMPTMVLFPETGDAQNDPI